MATDVIVLDTHALLWWALDPDQLSPVAVDQLSEVEKNGGFASSISVWELAIKVKRRNLELGITVDELVRRLERSAMIELVPVDAAIWLKSVALDWDHRDPADRVIVATALIKGVPVLTKDRVIREFTGVTSIW